MAVNRYMVELADPYDNKITEVFDFFLLEFWRYINTYGTLTLDLPISFYSLAQKDLRLKVFRSAGDGPLGLSGETAFLLRDWVRFTSADGTKKVRFIAFDANWLLTSRIVAYYAGSSQASKSGPADDVIKTIVSENMGSAVTDTARNWATFVSIQDNLGKGATVSKDFSNRPMLTVVQELAQDSTTSGTYLAFDMVYNGKNFEFRTYAGQRGSDRTPGSAVPPIILDESFGQLGEVEREEDYRNEVSFVYSGGQGEGANRVIKTSPAPDRIASSPFGRREIFVDARNSQSDASVQAEGDAAIRSGRGVRTFKAKVADGGNYLFERDYFFGDIVTAQYEGEPLNCRIDGYKIRVEGGHENLEIRLQSSD